MARPVQLAAAALCSLLAGRAAAEPAGVQLRGAAERPERRLAQRGPWVPLGGGNRVADEEGAELFQAAGGVDECSRACSLVPDCHSFAYCGAQACYLRTAVVGPSTPSHFNEFCSTYYDSSAAVTTTTTNSGTAATSLRGASTTAPPTTTAESTPTVCHKFSSDLAMSEKQRYEGNPDVGLAGHATFTLCTDGTLTAAMDLVNGSTRVLATHIHRCQGGDTPQTRIAALCDGPPVVNFCGANAVAKASDGTAYPEGCVAFDDEGNANTTHMAGVLIAANTAGTTAAALVQDIYANPNKYFFNVHTQGSFRHFQPKDHQGAVRGAMVSADELPSTTTTTPTPAAGTAASEENECFHVYAQLLNNELQRFRDNPDADAAGFAEFVLCTNGTAKGTMLLYGGRTTIIASHIHLCSGGDSPQTRTAELCEGAPVINFCGDNAPGLLADGTPYPAPCSQWAQGGSAVTRDMPGTLVAVSNVQTTFAQRVRHIVAHPELYYFNIHTQADYNFWFPKHNGACRGPLTLSSR